MADEPKPDPQIPADGDKQEPPPFEPDEELITYLERGRDSKG